jgi:hypothetical protein
MSKNLLLETLQWLDTLDYKFDNEEELGDDAVEYVRDFPETSTISTQTRSLTPVKSEKSTPRPFPSISVGTLTSPVRTPRSKSAISSVQSSPSRTLTSPSRTPKRVTFNNNNGYLDTSSPSFNYDSDDDYTLYRSSSLLYILKKWSRWLQIQKEGGKSQFISQLSEGMLLTRIPAWRSYIQITKGFRKLQKYSQERKTRQQTLLLYSPSLLKYQYKKKLALAFWRIWQKHNRLTRKRTFQRWQKRKDFFRPVRKVKLKSFFLFRFLIDSNFHCSLDGFSAFKKNCAFGTSGMEAKG